MTWPTRFTEMFGVRYPVALAPMGGSAGGALAAAVSNAGGLGLLGGGSGYPKWLEPELEILAGSTDQPWGVGLLSWAVQPATVERVLEAGPAAVMLSFGTRGASGALIGTRFQATREAVVDPGIKRAIVAGRGEETERSSVLDIVSGSRWPREYTGRTLPHPFLDQWRDREDELAGDAGARQAYRDGVARGDLLPQPAWAGEAMDLISDLPPAAEVVATLVGEAEQALAGIR